MANWKENKLVGVGAGVILVLCVVAFIFALQPKKGKMCLMSKGGHEVFKIAVPDKAQFPLKNPKTGKNDLYPAVKVKCQKCGWTGYIISYFEPGKPSEVTCPKCGAGEKLLIKTS